MIKTGRIKSNSGAVDINLDAQTINFGNKFVFDGTNLSIMLNSGKTIEEEIGGKNLIENSFIGKYIDGYGSAIGRYVALEIDKTYTFSMKYNAGSNYLSVFIDTEDLVYDSGTYVKTFTATSTEFYLTVIGYGLCFVEWVKLEEGYEATPWKPMETDKVIIASSMGSNFSSIGIIVLPRATFLNYLSCNPFY